MQWLVFLSLLLFTYALTETEYRAAFEDFKTTYGKVYLDSEETHRYNVFKGNLDFVNNWDSADRGFEVGINKFADISSAEFASIYNGFRSSQKFYPVNDEYLVTDELEVTGDIVNWVTKGAVTPVKNQGQCGSCWSFSATGAMEGSKFIKTGVLTSLSEQNLCDCSSDEGNDGCNGGLMDDAFQYVIDVGGLDTEASYPYTATGPNNCKYDPINSGESIYAFKDIRSGSESSLQTAATTQPISVAIDASRNSFQLYKSGIYYEPECSQYELDHGVLVVGFGTDSSNNAYWLVKNSWGTDWGMQGYIQMSRNRNNNCGISTSASYPIQ